MAVKIGRQALGQPCPLRGRLWRRLPGELGLGLGAAVRPPAAAGSDAPRAAMPRATKPAGSSGFSAPWLLCIVRLEYAPREGGPNLRSRKGSGADGYRSGHNGADSKSDGRVIPAREFESHPRPPIFYADLREIRTHVHETDEFDNFAEQSWTDSRVANLVPERTRGRGLSPAPSNLTLVRTSLSVGSFSSLSPFFQQESGFSPAPSRALLFLP